MAKVRILTRPFRCMTIFLFRSSGSQVRSELRLPRSSICSNGRWTGSPAGCNLKELLTFISSYYPETVSRKYFVNVPLIMQWMMCAMKALMSIDSIQKTTWLTYGNTLHTYIGQDVPKPYGGNAASLEERGITTKFGQVAPEPATLPTAGMNNVVYS